MFMKRMIIDLFSNAGAFSYCDSPQRWQLYTQDPATPTFEGMIAFHNYLTFFMVLIGTFVFWLLYKIIISFNNEANKTPLIFTHSSILEIVWTIIPALILLVLAVPSFSLLYSLDEIINPVLTVKVIGHQWYWSYEFSSCVKEFGDSKGKRCTIQFDAYNIPDSKFRKGLKNNARFLPRLLATDMMVMLPVKTHIRVLITAADVLHSWAVPSFGIKVDACPGRLSQSSLYIKREGYYFGQCSEICGVNHGFMPIMVRAVSKETYEQWLKNTLETL